MSPMEATVDPLSPGSRLDADHPENGVLIPCLSTARRGLRGVKLVVSDAHEGMKAAIAKVLNSSWQRCRYVLLRREGHAVNRKRVQRLYREERLTVRRRGGRKRAIGTRRPMVTPLAADQRWSLDFVSDQLTDGRRFRIFPDTSVLHTRAPLCI